ncbi:MAG TPA: hypothetical protein VKA27_11785 [Sunxiuqinia sp.]|nr:hypothetical protein [Sunxiuqinia sp.]
MKKSPRNERILYVAVSILLFSIILMIITIPVVFIDTSPHATPRTATTAIFVAIVIHLIILFGYIKVIRENRHNLKSKNGEYIGIGVLLILFGLIYMDGAFAFSAHETTLWVSILMFTSTLCDFTAAVMTIIVFFLKPQKTDKKTHQFD